MESTLERAAMQIALSIGRRVFAGHRDRDEKLNDCLSVAWEFAQGAPSTATPQSVAYFAVQRVRNGGAFSRRSTSIDNPRRLRSGMKKPARCEVETFDGFIGRPNNPAEIAAYRLDTRAWWRILSARQQMIAGLLALGWRPGEVAEMLDLSPGRISQIRRECFDKWEVLQA